MQFLEMGEQKALFEWARRYEKHLDGLHLLRGSMNAAKRTPSEGWQAKAMGMLPGEHDVTLPCPRGGFTGLSIELKHGDNKPTKEQLDYGESLEREDWLVVYLWSWTEAKELIERYLRGYICKVRW